MTAYLKIIEFDINSFPFAAVSHMHTLLSGAESMEDMPDFASMGLVEPYPTVKDQDDCDYRLFCAFETIAVDNTYTSLLSFTLYREGQEEPIAQKRTPLKPYIAISNLMTDELSSSPQGDDLGSVFQWLATPLDDLNHALNAQQDRLNASLSQWFDFKGSEYVLPNLMMTIQSNGPIYVDRIKQYILGQDHSQKFEN